jgi:MFS family permease
VLCAAGIAVSLMQTLVIPLIPELPMLLNASPSNASWAITATLLTAAVATPVFGRLGDMYGPKPILILCTVLLAAGSLTAALTTSLLPVIVGRALQGFGMPIIPLGISVLRASVPADRVGSAMGMMSASLGVGGALGLPLSAVIAQNFDWHALFWFATGLGAASAVLFALMVPRIPASSSDRFDLFGTIGLAAGLVTLLLPISKGANWGWTSVTTLGLFAASVVIFAIFAMWQLRTPAPLVDLRTTLRRPVLTTNLASIGVGFALFATSLIGPQILELPRQTGYGLGQSMLHAGLWMAPGGLAMMVSAPIAAKVAARRGPKFTLVIGAVVVAAAYLAGTRLLGSPLQVLIFNVLVSLGVGFAFASLPALINAAVPVSETAAANGINALARSLGTSTSSAVMSAVLAGMTVTFAGHELPSLTGFRTALLVAAGAAAVAAVLALAIPTAGSEDESGESVAERRPPVRPDRAVRELEVALTMLGRHAAMGPYADGAPGRGAWLDRRSYLLMSGLDATEPMSVEQLAATFGVDPPTVGWQISALLQNRLVARVGDFQAGWAPRFRLTPFGRERLYRQRAHKIQGLHRAVVGWEAEDVAALVGYVGRLSNGIDGARAAASHNGFTGRTAPSHSWSGSARR